ncbi:hypothetical protein FNH22_06735 [Fulvivirga sp. M361]|uniref:hypothetical protein n=1 Tax=Fulvivirga sp. M361 TaxID=2594266 RepID=UPI00117BA99E|nr:hypothetical protein [Fulvivirga sp. M361]TRX60735.1 hypothetical protein FNH22_06735 [Fulvivirga sp. M361]
MPAKSKYLSDTWTRVSKVTAAILGSYIATMLMHIATATLVTNNAPVILTTSYSAFLIWIAFMVLAFFIKKAWHVWCLFGSVIIVCSLIIFS